MARDETGKRHGRGGKVGRMARDETGKRHGRGGKGGRMARDETGKLARAGRKRRADGARRNGKNWHGRGGNPKRGGGKIDANRPQQQTQPNKLAVTPE